MIWGIISLIIVVLVSALNFILLFVRGKMKEKGQVELVNKVDNVAETVWQIEKALDESDHVAYQKKE